MKIEIQNGRVVCNMSDKNEAFWERVAFVYFVGHSPYGNSYSYMKPAWTKYHSFLDARQERNYIDGIIFFAEHYGVEVDSEVYKLRDWINQQYEDLKAQDEQDKTQEQKQKEWKRLCDKGCNKCEKLKQIGEDSFFCGETGEELEMKNKPFYDFKNRIHYLFNYEPFPSENCPRKI